MGRGADEQSEQDLEAERRERYRELLEELRTIQPGVQVLFGFLLIAPFSERFPDLDTFGRRCYLVALLSIAVAAVCFITPAAFHRIGRRKDRRERLVVGIVGMVAGLCALATGMTAAILAVARFVAGPGTAWAFAAVTGGLIVLAWYLLPVVRRRE